MKKSIILFLIFGFCNCFGQKNVIKSEIMERFRLQTECFVGVDILGNYYYLNDNTFFKQNKEAILEYKNPSFGKISKIDLQNPLKIILFYEDFNTIITLDNQLNETQKINFSENATPINVVATGIASGNRFWVYNSLNNQIGLYDGLNGDYKTISLSISGNIKFCQSDFNSFYWADEKNKFYVIDVFGKITILGILPDFDEIQVISNQNVIYKKNNSLYFFSLNDSKSSLIELDKKTTEKFYYENQILSIFTKQEITNYKITIP